MEIFKFFRKDGTDITPEIDGDGVYRINLKLNKVSVGLFETESIYILQDVLTRDKNEIIVNGEKYEDINVFFEKFDYEKVADFSRLLSDLESPLNFSSTGYVTFNDILKTRYKNSILKDKYGNKVVRGDTDVYDPIDPTILLYDHKNFGVNSTLPIYYKKPIFGSKDEIEEYVNTFSKYFKLINNPSFCFYWNKSDKKLYYDYNLIEPLNNFIGGKCLINKIEYIIKRNSDDTCRIFETFYNDPDTIKQEIDYNLLNNSDIIQLLDCDNFSLFGENNSITLTQYGQELINMSYREVKNKIIKDLGFEHFLTKPRLKTFDNKELNCLFLSWKKQNRSNHTFKIFDISDETIEVKNNYNTYFDEVKHCPSIRFIDLNLETNKTLIRDIFVKKYTFDNADKDLLINDDIYLNKPVVTTENLNQEAFRINICAESNIGDYYQKTLNIFALNSISLKLYKIAEINLEITIEDEDERLQNLLQNFGHAIDVNDYYVLKDFDLDEDRYDYIFLNQKRKELLLQSDEIFPYIGSEKCLRNGIKFLGFQDVDIQEYFYNVKTWDYNNKHIDYKVYESNLDYTSDDYSTDYEIQKYSNIINDSNWAKTSRLGLTYYYNEYTGETDNSGRPIVTNKEDFDMEELSIKMFGLKKFLYKYLLPHNARIINFSLNGIYFEKFKIINWNDIIPIFKVLKDPEFDFKIEKLNDKKIPALQILKYYYNDDPNKNQNRNILTYDPNGLSYYNLPSNNLNVIKSDQYVNYTQAGEPTRYHLEEYFKDGVTVNDIKNYEPSELENEYINYENNKEGLVNSEESKLINTNVPEMVQEIKYDIFNQYENISDHLKQISDSYLIDLPKLKVNVFRLTIKPEDITFEKLKGIPIRNLGLSPTCAPYEKNSEYYVDELNTSGNFDPTKCYNQDERKFIQLTFSDFRMHINRYVEWRFTSVKNDYKEIINGNYSDENSLIFFTPEDDLINVNCSIHDNYNFPKIVTHYINETEELSKDIIAFGRYKSGSIINFINQSTSTIENIKGNFIYPFTYKIESTFEDYKYLTFEEINFYNYLNCEYYLNYKKYSEIKKNGIGVEILDSDNFYSDFKNYHNNWKYLYLYKDTRDYIYNDVKIDSINGNELIFNNKVLSDNLKVGDKLDIYKIFETSNFEINDNIITLEVPTKYPLTIFKSDSLITLFDPKTDNESKLKKSKTYKVKEIHYNYIINKVTITIDDFNRDLDFPSSKKTNELDSKAVYNFSDWNKLQIRYDFTRCLITEGVNYNASDNLYYMKISLSKKTLKNIQKDLDKINFYISTANQDYYLKKIELTSDLIDEINYNEGKFIPVDNCDIDPYTNLVWAPFDILYGKYISKFEHNNFENYDFLGTTFENMKQINFDLLNFNSTYNTEFTLKSLSRIDSKNLYKENEFNEYYPELKINDYVYTIKIPFELYSIYNTKKENQAIYTDYLINYINKEHEGPLRYFNAYNKNGNIKCIAKSNIKYVINELSSKVFKVDKTRTVPEFGWIKNTIEEFPKIENPKYSSYLNLAYIENGSYFEDKDTEWYSSYNFGKSNFDNFFIKKDYFNINSPCFVFFKKGDSADFPMTDWDYEWSLYLGTKLILKSKLSYINAFINEKGQYSLKLEMINKFDSRKNFTTEKTNFVNYV